MARHDHGRLAPLCVLASTGRLGAFDISEWALEADGATARGTATVRYAEVPLAYALTVAAWRIDLAALNGRLPFSRAF